MRRPTVLVLLLLVLATTAVQSPIKYIIFLMMENRSFDHLLGHLAKANPNIDGLNGSQYNPLDPSNPRSPHIAINYKAVDGGPDDPCHSFDCITQQIFGFKKAMNDSKAPVKMNGFVANAVAERASYDFVMSAFNETNLPVLSTLAQEFALFDHWHCSVPGPTNPNREFALSGTSHGMVENTIPKEGFPQETHFAFLERHNISFKIYYNDDPWMAPCFADLRTPSRFARVQEMPHFYDDLANGTLPQYVHIQPRLATSHTGPSNWQHPDNSVEEGERFINEVYTALRASKYWEESLLIITYDEHGGFYDHQATPTTGVPPPDNVRADNGFDFTRLGVRIPTVMVSPWIAKGTLVHEPTGARAPFPTSQYEATSIISSVNKIFGITEHMTARDAWAGTFHDLVAGQTPVRRDCPTTLPTPARLGAEALEAEMDMPLNDHHLDSLNLLCHLSQHAHPVCADYSSTQPAAKAKQASFKQRLLAHQSSKHLTPVFFSSAERSTSPFLDAEIAPLMRQRNFGASSKLMTDAYRVLLGAQ